MDCTRTCPLFFVLFGKSSHGLNPNQPQGWERLRRVEEHNFWRGQRTASYSLPASVTYTLPHLLSLAPILHRTFSWIPVMHKVPIAYCVLQSPTWSGLWPFLRHLFFFPVSPALTTLQLIPFTSIHWEGSFRGFPLLFILALIQISLLQIPAYLKAASWTHLQPSYHLWLYSL